MGRGAWTGPGPGQGAGVPCQGPGAGSPGSGASPRARGRPRSFAAFGTAYKGVSFRVLRGPAPVRPRSCTAPPV